MSDTRTLREKLAAMADQAASPNEAEIARAKLATMGAEPPKPPRPTRVGASYPDPGFNGTNTTSTWTFQGFATGYMISIEIGDA